MVPSSVKSPAIQKKGIKDEAEYTEAARAPFDRLPAELV